MTTTRITAGTYWFVEQPVQTGLGTEDKIVTFDNRAELRDLVTTFCKDGLAISRFRNALHVDGVEHVRNLRSEQVLEQFTDLVWRRRWTVIEHGAPQTIIRLAAQAAAAPPPAPPAQQPKPKPAAGKLTPKPGSAPVPQKAKIVPPPLPPRAPLAPKPAGTAPPMQKKPAPAKEITCKLVNAVVTCQHGRAPSAKGELEVVAGGVAGDTINCNATSAGTCGKHPLWEISGARSKQAVGNKANFFALHGQNYKPITGHVFLPLPVWLGNVQPWEYQVSVGSCAGDSHSYTIKSYPGDEVSLSLTGQAWEKQIEPVVKKINKYLSKLTGVKVEVEFFKGGLQYSARWAEDGQSHRAYYNWSVAGTLSPLAGIRGRFPLLPQVGWPGVAAAGCYLQFGGEVNVNIKCSQSGPGKVSGAGSAEGKVSIGVCVSAYLIDEDVLSAEAYGFTAISGEVEVEMKRPPEAELELVWQPLRLKLSYTVLFFTHEHEMKVFDDIEIGKWSWPLFNEAQASGGAA